jgi:hypothetical protein
LSRRRTDKLFLEVRKKFPSLLQVMLTNLGLIGEKEKEQNFI